MSSSTGFFGFLFGFFAFLILMAASSGSAQSKEMTVQWKDGLRFESPESEVSMKLGGRILNDWAWFPERSDASVSTSDATEFRRARIYLAGKLGGGLIFKSQIDFSSGEVAFKDMYMGIEDLPVVGELRVGQMKEPFSLEELTSSNYITFMERSPAAAFDAERNTGIMVQNAWSNERVLASLGIFRDTNETGAGRGDAKYNYSARLSGLPYEDTENHRLIHLGMAGSFRKTQDGMYQVSIRPSSHLTDKILHSDVLMANEYALAGFEAAAEMGPFSVDAEYRLANVNAITASNPNLSGFYVAGSWFLTGENRPYNHSEGAFGHVKPSKPLGSGSGAWEFAVRVTHVDLSDADGGQLDDYTVGINWYANNNARVMLNYVYSDANEHGQFSGLQTRFMVYF